MFSIAAINGGGSQPPRLDALQPTKEAQEACLAQRYQEALTDLQNGDLDKARLLLESILQDPIILQAAASMEKNYSESTGLNPMLQLRFSTLKNLAETLYKQDKIYHSDALGYYLQAASIDRGDSVLWNRLGTLACALGHLNIARIGFEQGLLCSPRNWLCMEKLVEVLIAIGDEEACRHTVKRLLKISPSHPRATYIENVLESSADGGEILKNRANFHGCFVKLGTLPRGLDLLEPQHFSLSFPVKRKTDNVDEDERRSKRRKIHTVEVCPPDLSWGSILICVLDCLQVRTRQTGSKTLESLSLRRNGLNCRKSFPNPEHPPLVNSLIAIVADSRIASVTETAAAVHRSEEDSLQKVPVAEKQKSPTSGPSALSFERTACVSQTKVVQLVSSDTASEAITSSEGERRTQNRRSDDLSLSADLNQTSKQIKGETNGHLKRAVSTYEDALYYQSRRITRLARIRTQRDDKDDEMFENKDQIESFRQLLEPYVCTVAPDEGTGLSHEQGNVGSRHNTVIGQNGGCAGDSTGPSEDISVQDGAFLDEELEVQKFCEELKVNSGPYHIAHELLEKLAATHCKRSLPILSVLKLEDMTRQFSGKTRSRQCSLFLAEICLEMFLSSPCPDSSASPYLRECGFHLCMVLERSASHARFRDSEYRLPTPDHSQIPDGIDVADKKGQTATAPSERIISNKRSRKQSRDTYRDLGSSATSKSGQPGLDITARTSKVQHTLEIVNAGKDDDWRLWVRFHWLEGQWLMFSGRQEDAYQELTLCLAILDNRSEQDDNSSQTLFSNSDVETVITQAKVQRKLYELHIDKLLRHVAAQMVDSAMFSDLIDLLEPLLLLDNDSEKAKLGYDETKRGVVDSSPEYVGLGMLICACEKVDPPNLWLALQCHARKLEFLCSALSDINATGIIFSLESIRLDRCSSALELEIEQGKGNYVESRLVTEELKAISSCAASIREQVGESGSMVTSPDQAKLLRQVQHLLLDSMCHYIKSQDDESSSSFNIQFDSCLFVDACIAFCRLQHLDANATLKQQVLLLGTAHDLLAIRGLCCAGKGCYGGEGAFLKLAIKQLGTVELKLRLPFAQQERSELANGGTGEVLEIENEDENESSQSSDKQAAEDNQEDPITTAKEEQEEEIEQYRLELGLDSVMDQCFFCLYGLNLRGSFEMSNQIDGLTEHKNTNRGDYETQEQCAGVYQYILPYAKACSRARLTKLRKVLRAVYKQFPSPPPDLLAAKSVEHFLDDLSFDEEELHTMVVSGKSLSDVIDFALKVRSSEDLGHGKRTSRQVDMVNGPQSDVVMSESVMPTNGYSKDSGMDFDKTGTVVSAVRPGNEDNSTPVAGLTADHGEPYLEVYENLYHLVSEVEDISASEKWAGFVLKKEGEEYVEQNAKLLKYDLCFNPLRFESWYKLAKIYDEEVDLMLNDGSKNINVVDWRGNNHLTQRVEISRRRARRCLLMTLALSNSTEKQSEIHELLALVYYDCLQNVAPSFDQRSNVPQRDAAWISLCQKSLEHFEAAFKHRPDWTHLLYMGKLCEKLCRSSEEAFDFYKRAVDMKPSAVDPVYRLHASRLKLLCKSDERDLKTLPVIAEHCFLPSIKERACSLLESLSDTIPKIPSSATAAEIANSTSVVLNVRKLLFDDCVAAMRVCVEGELKHFHKARFRLADCYYSPTEIQDMDKAKEELAFCFRSSRSLFTINMWEIDGSLRKIRRKAAHPTNLDVQMPESSRKFITCVRKYLVLYLSLCEKTGDICTLERAFSSLKTDKKFSLCLDDLSRVALGKYVQALVMEMRKADASETVPLPTICSLLERFFNLFMEYGSSWPESLQMSLTEAEVPSTDEFSEGLIFGYIHRYLDLLENDLKLDAMEAINEKIRKRFRNLKPAASPVSQVCQHSCLAWARALCFSLASITPLPECRPSPQSQTEVSVSSDQTAGLIVDLQEDTFRAISYQVSGLQTATEQKKTGSVISTMKAVPVKRALADNLERATALLRSTYVFYRDSLSGPFPDGINLFLVAADGSNNEIQNAEALDISTPRKLLLWAFTLVHGRTGSVAEAVKYCEEQAKPRHKKTSVSTPPAVVVNNSRE